MQHAQQPEQMDPAREEPAPKEGAGPNSATPGSVAARGPARRRFGAVQIGLCLLFFVEGLLGLFVVGWPALSLCVLGTLYMAKVAQRHDAQPGRSKA
ncbi:hypothetical protein HS961_00360 [Comamonas piscis]|uniref:Uncharacterized protein n=1 Tax=Comamonas piscis TaxID=1562974 RepID=A0A7G5EBN7_9BURK|nr:hypothetical protein [Comamonas piscis]QMV71412.1 hypothetical protein HS961_00360 [Comamonas piscis]WSO34120.1 hypothetical protein VUJ63_00360 [Comamonas piscis]